MTGETRRTSTGSRMSFLNRQKSPLMIEPAPAGFDSLLETVFGNRQFFREKLLSCGALLFRGYKVDSAAKFERFVRVFSGKELFDYAGGASPRVSLGIGGVYTSTEYPPEIKLSLHNELSYADRFPAHIYFCCLTAPQIGGETTFGDSRRILQKIDPEVVEIFRRKKVCYVRNLKADQGSGYSWQEAFETGCKLAGEDLCRKIGADFQWKADGSLRLRQTRPATLTHPVTGEEVWFNQADGFHPSNLGEEFYQNTSEDEFRLNCRFGDGTPIDLEILKHIRAVIESETVPHQWQTGDILVLDNILFAHGRMPFSGARKIAAAMT